MVAFEKIVAHSACNMICVVKNITLSAILKLFRTICIHVYIYLLNTYHDCSVNGRCPRFLVTNYEGNDNCLGPAFV